jgi:hypothetical protein
VVQFEVAAEDPTDLSLLAEDRIAPYNSQFLLQRVKVEAHVFLELGLERAPRSAVCRAR